MRKILTLALALAAPCAAAPILLSGSGEFGSFTGTMEYLDQSQTLVLTLKNTTPVYGGFLTGVALNNPGGVITGVTLAASNLNFVLIGGPHFNDAVKVAPYGQFDFGASVSNSWLGGGNPSGGIPAGGSASFAFKLSGNLVGLTTDSFALPLGGDTQRIVPLVARFRGMSNCESDKVPGTIDEIQDPLNQVPEPATYAMIGAGLAAAAALRRFRKSSSMRA